MRTFLAGILAIAFATPAVAQSYDWPTLLREASSSDRAVQEPAQKHITGTVLPELAKRSPDQLAAEILAVVEIGKQDESLRLASSAVFSSLQLGIRDTSYAFSPIIPSVIVWFHDSNVRVRRNSVSLVANLLPDVPEIAVQPFIDSLMDSDSDTARSATVGLARLCKYPAASKALRNLFESNQPKSIRIRVIGSIGSGRCEDPGILMVFGKTFDEHDRDVVLAAIQSVSRLGPAGRIFKPQLDAAKASSDQEIAKSAVAAAARLP